MQPPVPFVLLSAAKADAQGMTLNTMLAVSGTLFCIGFLGVIRSQNIVRIFISAEIMMFASILNLGGCKNPSTDAQLAILLAVTLGCLAFCVVFMILCQQLMDDKSANILEEKP